MEREQQETMKRLKGLLVESPIPKQLDFSRPFILDTDTNNSRLEAILIQEEKGVEHSIRYASRTLGGAEKRYSIAGKEIPTAILEMEYFYYYLYGKEFKLRSEHKILEAFNSKGMVESDRMRRRIKHIQNYSFNVEFLKTSHLQRKNGT
jgi:hypothetical protein